MVLNILPLGGFGEVGRNCLGIDVDGKIILIDFGFNLERFLELGNRDDPSRKIPMPKLLSSGALPAIGMLKGREKDVVGILCSHAHLDHIAAVPYLVHKLNCNIHATPFTAAVMRSLRGMDMDKIFIKEHKSDSSFTIAGIKIDFIGVSHSTPDSVIIAVHTSEGTILYANDFKLDENPVIGTSTSLSKLDKYKGKVKILLLDCLYATKKGHCPSEREARKDVLNLKLTEHRAIVVSTFSSHIARLKSIAELAKTTNREIVFMGSSLGRYIDAAKDTELVDLAEYGQVLRFSRQVNGFFETLEDPSKYFMIVTGHQGEDNAVLTRMTDGLFDFKAEDVVVFSNTVIPADICIENRKALEEKLNDKNVTMIKNIHVSGHLFSDDHRQVVEYLCPTYVIPSHGEHFMEDAMVNMLKNIGFPEKNILKLQVGKKREFFF